VLLEEGLDGVAGGHGEGWRVARRGGTSGLRRSSRVPYLRHTGEDAAEVGRGDPVLTFGGQAVVGDAEEAFDGDFYPDFFFGFADGAGFQRLEVVEFAAYDAPVIGFGGRLRRVRRMRPSASVRRTPTPTLVYEREKWSLLGSFLETCGARLLDGNRMIEVAAGRSKPRPYDGKTC